MSELDPFFNDEALVKGITKDSRRLRPYGTVCVMPKYTSAIVNEFFFERKNYIKTDIQSKECIITV